LAETQSKAEREAASAEDAAKRARHLAKLESIRRISIYKSRAEALEELIDEEQKKLKLLMSQDGDRQLGAFEGTGKFIPKRTFEAMGVEALCKAFTKEQLAEGFKPTADFVDACVKAGVDYKNAIAVGVREDFEVKRAQTAAARKQQEQIIDETRRQMEATVDALAKRLARANKESK
jgi:hypothetical protein